MEPITFFSETSPVFRHLGGAWVALIPLGGLLAVFLAEWLRGSVRAVSVAAVVGMAVGLAAAVSLDARMAQQADVHLATILAREVSVQVQEDVIGGPARRLRLSSESGHALVLSAAECDSLRSWLRARGRAEADRLSGRPAT